MVDLNFYSRADDRKIEEEIKTEEIISEKPEKSSEIKNKEEKELSLNDDSFIDTMIDQVSRSFQKNNFTKYKYENI